MKKQSLFFIFILMFIISNLFHIPNIVYSMPNDHTLNLIFDRDFYIKGETIQIYGISNISLNVELSIYWNWNLDNPENELVYQNSKLTNASWSLPTDNIKVGHYKCILKSFKYNITVWRTLIHTTNYVSENLPFSHTWKNINYTLEGRTLRAETQEDYLEITYPKIPFNYNVNMFRNNMSFVIRLSGITWNVDITYITLYSGLKWVINGTLDNPVTFEFECSHNPLIVWKRYLDSFKSNNMLTFDWSDIRKAKQAFNWNSTTKILSVNIPSNFWIDPLIFEDGFESGDLSGFTGSSGSPTVQSSVKHCGTYSVYIDASEYVYKDLGSTYSEFYARVYIQFDTLINEQYYYSPFLILGSASNWAYATQVELYCTDGTNHVFRLVDGQGVDDEGTTIVSIDTWYEVELKRVTGSGTSIMYINDVQEASVVYGYYDTDRLQVGGYFTLSSSAYIDCVVGDINKIGLESGGAEERSFELFETIIINDTLNIYQEQKYLFSQTLSFSEGINYYQEHIYIYSDSFGISEIIISLQEQYYGFDSSFTFISINEIDQEILQFFIENFETLSIDSLLKIYQEHARYFSETVNINDISAINLETIERFFEFFEDKNILSGIHYIIDIPSTIDETELLYFTFICAIIGICLGAYVLYNRW